MTTSEVETECTEVACSRLPFLRVCCSPFGALLLLCSIPMLGLTLLILVVMHFVVMPRKVWARKGRLFATKALPTDGVPLEDVEWVAMSQHLLFWTVNRAIRLTARDGRGGVLALNQLYFGKEALDRLVAVLNADAPVALGAS